MASAGVGDNWWMLTNAVFARSYGRVDTLEDMATTFEAYFSRHGNSEVAGAGNAADPTSSLAAIDLMPAKKQFLDQLFVS